MNAAVFVDFENLYLSLKSRNDGTGVRTRELSLQILEGMLARLRKKGHPMVIGRSYAAFDTFPGIEMAHDLALMVSGRARFELTQKTLVAGMPLLAAVSAPSSLAVQLASEFDMTLVGFLRGNAFNIYAGERRIRYGS